MQDTYIVCPSCQGVNKLPSHRLTDGGKCGKCHHILLDGRVISASQAQFEKIIGRSTLPVVVDFWASWCGPCKMMAPVFEQVASTMRYQAHFVKVNTETEQNLAAQFQIRSIPTIALFKAGREISRQAGAMDAASLQRWVLSLI